MYKVFRFMCEDVDWLLYIEDIKAKTLQQAIRKLQIKIKRYDHLVFMYNDNQIWKNIYSQQPIEKG